MFHLGTTVALLGTRNNYIIIYCIYSLACYYIMLHLCSGLCPGFQRGGREVARIQTVAYIWMPQIIGQYLATPPPYYGPISAMARF